MQGITRAFRAQRLHQWRAWMERLVVWGAAVCAGVIIVGFARVTEWAGNLFVAAYHHWGWSVALVTPVAGMVIVAINRRWFSGAEGSGIPQTIAAIETDEGLPVSPRLLSLRIAAGKLVLGALALASGFSVGREGPSVQVGASIMYAFRRLLPEGHNIRTRDMILAGGAAGIAAAFNTPLAGIVFAIEELSRRFEQRTNGVLLTAIVIGGLVSISLQGNYLYFGHLKVEMIDHHIIVPVLVCSLVCGVSGGLLSRLLLYSTRPWPGPLGRLRATSPVWFAGFCGLVVALLGLATHGAVHGSGYMATREMLGGDDLVAWYFAPAKFIATAFSYFSGIPGGIFAPSLSIGAGIGRDLLPLFSDVAVASSIFALCMAAFLAAVTQAPITSFIIVMEMIDGHEMVISLMAVTLLSSLIARTFSPPLYHALAQSLIPVRDKPLDGAVEEHLDKQLEMTLSPLDKPEPPPVIPGDKPGA